MHLDVLVYSVYVLLQCDYVDVYVLKVKQTRQTNIPNYPPHPMVLKICCR